MPQHDKPQWSKITGKKFENIIETPFTGITINKMGCPIVHKKYAFPACLNTFFSELDEIQTNVKEPKVSGGFDFQKMQVFERQIFIEERIFGIYSPDLNEVDKISLLLF